MRERIVVVGYGTVGARFVEELLPAVRSGAIELTVIGAEAHEAYNRVLIAEYAAGRADRAALELLDAHDVRAAGVRIITDTTVTTINRTRRTVSLGSAEDVPYDRLVLATGARANVPTLEGVKRVRREVMRPPLQAAALDWAEAPLPRGVTVLRDLDDAARILDAVNEKQRIVVLGAGVLGMELALATAAAGSETCVVYHSESPMDRNLDRGGGAVLAASARRAGVTMINHSRAEAVICHLDDDGSLRFDALVCADGKQINGDLLVLSCGVHARTELAYLAGLAVAGGVLVDEQLRSWTDPHIYAIGDCAQVAPRPIEGASTALPAGGPSGLVGPGWRQADWLARDIVGSSIEPMPADRGTGVVMLKADGIDVVAAGDVRREPWDVDFDETQDHALGCEVAPQSVSQWIDPEHGRYVKMVTRAGILDGFVSIGMPRTAAELTLLFERRSELPADRSVLLRFDGPDYDPTTNGEAFAPASTVCWCNAVSVEAITVAAHAGNTTVACISSVTRAGTGCGGCKVRIGEVLDHVAAGDEVNEVSA